MSRRCDEFSSFHSQKLVFSCRGLLSCFDALPRWRADFFELRLVEYGVLLMPLTREKDLNTTGIVSPFASVSGGGRYLGHCLDGDAAFFFGIGNGSSAGGFDSRRPRFFPPPRRSRLGVEASSLEEAREGLLLLLL